jgi:hypothetical protein
MGSETRSRQNDADPEPYHSFMPYPNTVNAPNFDRGSQKIFKKFYSTKTFILHARSIFSRGSPNKIMYVPYGVKNIFFTETLSKLGALTVGF